jgi:glutathione S-transferase
LEFLVALPSRDGRAGDMAVIEWSASAPSEKSPFPHLWLRRSRRRSACRLFGARSARDRPSTVKLYTSPTAPNPRRVHIFAAEKGIELDYINVSLRDGDHFSDDYLRLNPDRVVPTLVLDDETVIHESVAICRYLDAAFPEPNLCGATPAEIGLVSMWVRRVELQMYQPVQDAYRNSRRGFAGRALPGSQGDVPQIPELVARSNQVFARMAAKLETALAQRDFVALPRYSLADTVAFTTYEFALRTKMQVAPDCLGAPATRTWYDRMLARPSSATEGSP